MKNSVFMLNETEKSIPYILFHDPAGNYVPAHWHREIEIILCTKGKTNMVINNSMYELREADIAVVLDGDTHLYFRAADHERTVVMFDYGLFESYGSDSAKRSELQTHLKRLPRVSSMWNEHHRQQATQILNELERLNKHEMFGRDLAIRARLYDLILLLCNDIAAEGTSELPENAGTTKMLENLEKVLDFVNNNYHQDITLGDAANVLGFSESYFARFFKKHAGETFITYLNAFRMNKARDLLFVGSLSIGRISEEVGIPNIKTFNRLFKNMFGVAPTQYKKSIYKK